MVRHLPRRSCSRVALLLPVIAVALVAASPQAGAQTTASPADGSFDGVLRALELKSNPTTSPDFVTRTRPEAGKLDYMPVGKRPPARTDKVLTPAEVSALTADLDASREKQQRRAGRTPAKVPEKQTKPAVTGVAKTIR